MRAGNRAVGAHFEHLKRLAASGEVELAGRTTEDDETTIGLVLLSVSSEDEARRLMEADPAVKAGVMKGELRPFRMAVAPAASRA